MTIASDRLDLVAQVETIDCLVRAHGDTTGQPIDSVTEADYERLMAASLGSVFVT